MNHALLAAVAVLMAGCQQPNGASTALPLTPGLPLNSTTRVPPPPTGHIGAPNPYVQTQASAAAPSTDSVAASNAPPSQAEAASPGDAAPVRAVSYVDSPSMGPAMATPSIPAEAFVGDLPPHASDVPLRPHLRGMEPIDLVPVQQVANERRSATAGSSPSISVASKQGSTAQAYRASSPAAAGDAWSGAESAAAANPSTEPRTSDSDAMQSPESTTQSVGDTLPWRKPTTAR